MVRERPIKPKKSGAPPIERLAPWLQGGAVVSIAFVVGFIIKGLATPLHHLNTFNTAQMKEVFLGNDTWVVLCSNTSEPVPERFTKAAKEVVAASPSIPFKFGVLDCSGTLPSGKDVYTKFSIERGDPDASKAAKGKDSVATPPVFIVGPGLKPQQAYSKHMSSQTGFNSWLKRVAENPAHPVTSTRELESRCLSQASCAVILKAGALGEASKAAMKHAMYTHRTLRFVHIDTTKYEMSLEKKLGIEPPSIVRSGAKAKKSSRSKRKKNTVKSLDQLEQEEEDALPLEELQGFHRVLLFKKNAKAGANPKVGTTRWTAQAYGGEMDGEGVGAWLDERLGAGATDAAEAAEAADKGKKKLAKGELPVTRLPTVMQRKAAKPKKEASPQQKQQQQQQQQQQKGEELGGGGESGYGGMDKDELIAALRKKQAERERQKRLEMDEEGSSIFEDEGGDGEEEEEEEVERDSYDSSDDEEEVLDLDEMD